MEVTKQILIDNIPSQYQNLITFVKGLHEQNYYDVEKNVLKIDEAEILGRQYLIDIDMNRDKIYFVDDLVVYDVVSNFKDNLDHKEWTSAYNELIANIKANGMSLIDLGNGGNEDYIWYSLVTDLKDFDYDKFIECTKLWSTYNNKRRDIYE